MRFSIVVAMLLSASWLVAQKVNPTSLTFEAVPPNTSPGEYIAFKNTGTTQLTLSISITPPFVISESRCANGVKPNTHCYLYLTYTAQTIGEVDNGSLT